MLVILDNVQFPQGTTWITRNRFKNDQGSLWMTIPVRKKGLGLQKIRNVRICWERRWAKKHLESLKHAYANAPYFPDHLQFVENLFLGGCESLIDFNMMIIRYLMLTLDVDTEVRLQSELEIEARGDRLLIEICQRCGASTYLAQSAARKYLNADLFADADIQILYLKPRTDIYPQLWGNFIPDLFALDLLFNCGPKAREIAISG